MFYESGIVRIRIWRFHPAFPNWLTSVVPFENRLFDPETNSWKIEGSIYQRKVLNDLHHFFDVKIREEAQQQLDAEEEIRQRKERLFSGRGRVTFAEAYAVLGLPDLGIPDETNVKKAQKARNKLAMKYHSDRNHTEEGEERMREINRAYEVLWNAIKK